MKEIQKIREGKISINKKGLAYKIQLFFTEWYCGIIGDKQELKALTSNKSYVVSKIITQLKGVKYQLELNFNEDK